jgi:23S rRNA (pseudouridine1915-N3)-methyltransferase
MRFLIVAVGTRMPAWVDDAFDEYARRMPRETRVELLEIKPADRTAGKPVEAIMEFEAARIAAALPADCELVALDERGKNPSTAELSEMFGQWLSGGRDVAFVIGGADGLHASIKARAARLLALSRMTLPHGLARVLLAEQLYRAMSLLKGHPYHRA